MVMVSFTLKMLKNIPLNFRNMKSITLIIVLTLLFSVKSQAQYVNVFGYIKDSTTMETLVGANVYDFIGSTGTTTNQFGFFSLRVLKEAKTDIEISFVGYAKKNLRITASRDSNLAIVLSPDLTLDEVEIKEKRMHEVKHDVLNIPIQKLKSVPSLGGEPDLLKALSLTPGIATGTEGTSGLYVRGGTPDQNLILIDGAAIYNTSHLFGFLSILNPNAVKSIEVIKGGFPARYGGRLSSVIDVSMKEGNNQKKQIEGSIGLINSNLTVEGPIQKGKSSYIFAGRGAYLSLLTLPRNLAYKKGKSDDYNNITTYDFSAKVNFDLPKNGRLFVSSYLSKDIWQNWERYSGEDSRVNLDWGNETFNVRYSKIVSSNLFAFASFNYSHFRYQTQLLNNADSLSDNLFFENKSDVKDATIKLGIEWQTAPHHVKTGLEIDKFVYNPTTVNRNISLQDTLLAQNNLFYRPLSVAAYIEDVYKVNENFEMNMGLRYVSYLINKKTYHSFEPRVSIESNFGSNNSINLSYSVMKQFVHLLSSYSSSLSNDIWAPATDKTPPQSVQQWSLGYNKQWTDNNWNLQIGAFYKSFANQIDYRQGANFFFTGGQTWEDAIEKKGIGRAYGYEVMLRKDGTDWNGWLSYTLSWNERKFQGIDNGNWYPQRYDRRHNVNLVFEQKMSEKWTFNSNFVFMTGHAVTLPDVVYKDIFGSATAFYTKRNNQRMPLYNRLDVSFTKSYKTKKRGRDAKWIYSVYNTYGYANAFALDYFVGSNLDSNMKVTGFKGIFTTKSLFRFVPGINWSIKL
jgi:TonB-dependent Receptor Plug Domain/CarboxypepD_reg-like domain